MSSVIRLKRFESCIVFLVLVSLFIFVAIRLKANPTFASNAQTKKQLKVNQNDVAVVIVDEHQEVIPYWYQAVEEGLINNAQNTLVHIDGHSDMATPENYDEIEMFNHKMPGGEEIFLPLMQANDVFITSSIAKGLIDRVIWVQPTWLSESTYIQIFNAFVGWMRTSDNSRTLCECMQRISIKKHKKHPYSCSYLNRDASIDNDDMNPELSVNISDCHKIHQYSFISMNEKKFLKYAKLHKVTSLFVDIDEDFFGVESGVQSYINKGIPLIVQNNINELLPVLFCPETVIEEQSVESQVHQMFLSIIKMELKDESKENVRSHIQAGTRRIMKQFTCDDLEDEIIERALRNFTDLILAADTELLEGIVNARYCLRMSPILRERSMFSLCSGNIFPNDQLNEIYVGSTTEIHERGKVLSQILQKINKQSRIRFVSIARSLRDGYTPRHQQRMIEKTILESLEEVFTSEQTNLNVIYDKHLSFGTEGWI